MLVMAKLMCLMVAMGMEEVVCLLHEDLEMAMDLKLQETSILEVTFHLLLQVVVVLAVVVVKGYELLLSLVELVHPLWENLVRLVQLVMLVQLLALKLWFALYVWFVKQLAKAHFLAVDLDMMMPSWQRQAPVDILQLNAVAVQMLH